MGVLLKMRSIFSPHHFWGTANLNLNLNLNLTLNRNFNFRNFCYDNICLITSILTWKLTKCPHKPTEKLGHRLFRWFWIRRPRTTIVSSLWVWWGPHWQPSRQIEHMIRVILVEYQASNVHSRYLLCCAGWRRTGTWISYPDLCDFQPHLYECFTFLHHPCPVLWHGPAESVRAV